MNPTATVALVGCGHWGRYILRDLKVLGCRVPVVARSAQSRARATEGGAHEIVERADLLRDLDGIVVATPTATHATVVDELLGLEIPIYVEKPMTGDAASARRLADVAGDRVFVMDKWRYHPGIEALAEIARTEELGRVRGLRTARLNWGNPHDDVDSVWILVPHDLSIALEVLGHIPEPRAAVADTMDSQPGDAHGLNAFLGGDPWMALESSTRYREHFREVRLLCDEGVAVLGNAYDDAIEIWRAGDVLREPKVERREISTEWPLLRELRAFVEHLSGGPPPRSTAAEGAATVSTIERLRELAGLRPGSRA
jgi:predicted dehydrogenase